MLMHSLLENGNIEKKLKKTQKLFPKNQGKKWDLRVSRTGTNFWSP